MTASACSADRVGVLLRRRARSRYELSAASTIADIDLISRRGVTLHVVDEIDREVDVELFDKPLAHFRVLVVQVRRQRAVCCVCSKRAGPQRQTSRLTTVDEDHDLVIAGRWKCYARELDSKREISEIVDTQFAYCLERSRYRAQLGACLVERGEDEEAQRALERGCEVTSADDIVDVVGLAALEAVLRARRGELGEVQELARRALARPDETDSIRLLLDTRWSAAEVFGAGRPPR